jgi:DNA-binding XRE family transcriptional regulator
MPLSMERLMMHVTKLGLSKAYGVSRRTIKAISAGKKWVHILKSEGLIC